MTGIPLKVSGPIFLAAGAVMAGVAVHDAATTKDVSIHSRAAQFGSVALMSAGIGVAQLASNPKIAIPALGVALLGTVGVAAQLFGDK